MKKILLFVSVAALALSVISCEKEKPNNFDNITEDGFYVIGDATGKAEVTNLLAMAKGINEWGNDDLGIKGQQERDGMYEKYIVLEGGKEFTLAYVQGDKKEAYGADLKAFKPAEFTGVYADNPDVELFKGKLVVGDTAPKMKVATTGLYHIVLDLNKDKLLTDALILVSPVTWGVRGGMNGWNFTAMKATDPSNDGITYTISGQELGNNGDFKFAYNGGWKIYLGGNADDTKMVKANTNLGTDCKPGGDNIVVTEGAGKYTIKLTFKLAAGELKNSYKYEITQESKADYPANLYMTGTDFGGWSWGSEGIVNIPHISAGGDPKDGCFAVTRYFKADNGVKFSTINIKDDWSKAFGGMTNKTGAFTFDGDGNAHVPSDGLWTITLDFTKDEMTLTEGAIYGMGPAFNGDWTTGKYAGTVNPDGTASITALTAGALRVYAPCAFDWWQHEFQPTKDGKIQYREGGELEGFEVAAGDVITFNFNEGTAVVGGGGGGSNPGAEAFLAWLANPTTDLTLDADVDLSGAAFTPAAEMTGNLNGNGHTITVKDAATPVIAVAKGAVKNVTFAGSFAATPGAEKLILAPIGKSYGEIENVTNKASVTITGPAGQGNAETAVGATAAGVVGEAYGPVKGCKNEGKISADASGKDSWTVVASGIVGFAASSVANCNNDGEVYLALGSPLGRTKGMTEVSMKYDPTAAAAGIAAYAVSDAEHTVTVDKCYNNAKISFIYDNLNANSSAVSRSPVSGIVANSGGDITDCHNTGEIYAKMVAPDRSAAYDAQNIILHAAGIQGADYFVKKIKSTVDQNETSVIGCTNSGKIVADSDMIKSNNTVGGISAWPAAESATVTVIKDCVNSGDIEIKGMMKIRAGGIAGGTNSIEGCKNTGNMLVEGADPASVFGLINGFHTQTHTLKDCEATGTITSAVGLNNKGGIGGICGGIGNAANTVCEGCKVNATLVGGGTTQVGLIVGHLNGNTKNISIGTAESPVKVAGSVDGTAATAENFMSLVQKAANYKEEVHTFNVVFGN